MILLILIERRDSVYGLHWLLPCMMVSMIKRMNETDSRDFLHYIRRCHGIDMKSSAPLTALDTQIIRLLPVAIEYIMSRDAVREI